MKYLIVFSTIVAFNTLFGQIEQIQTNCTDGIGYLKDSDTAKYFVSAQEAIIRYSKANGTITLLPVPHYSNGFNSGFEILGDSIFYVSTVFPGYPYPFILSRSKDFGQNWDIILDTVCNKDLANIIVMDTNQIYLLASAQQSLRTIDGGTSWVETIEVSNAREYCHFNDSIEFHTAFLGIGFTVNSGNTWEYTDNGFNLPNCDVYGFHVVSLDSIYTVSMNSCNLLSYCFSSDYSSENWQNVNVAGYLGANDLYAVSMNEIYLLGYTDLGKHRIAKTIDLGTTIQIFDPNINGEITSITPINDSVFLVSGTDGILYKWNKNQTQWGTLDLEESEEQSLKISPNPSSGVFTIDSEQPVEALSLTDFAGRAIRFDYNPQTGELNVDEPKGIYFLRLKQSEGTIVRKLVVE